MGTTKSAARASLAPEAPGPPPEASALSGWLGSGLVIAVAVAAILVFFLSVYPRQAIEVPLGWDTSRYLWQTTLVQEEGLSALGERLPTPFRPSLSRPAFPVVASSLSSLTTLAPVRLAYVFPTVLAVIVALAAGAFVTSSLRRPRWQLLLVLVAIATSAYVVRLAAPEAYQDNLASAALLLVAAIPIGMAVRGERGAVLPATAILGVAGITHWVFFLFFAGTLAVVGLLYLPGSWRRWRSGESLWRTPTARLATIVGGASVAAGLTIFGMLGARAEQPKLSLFEFRKKFEQDLPLFRFPAFLPMGLLGGAALAASPTKDPDSTARRRYVLSLLGAWTVVAAMGVAAYLAGVRVPAHRFLAFALSVPLLAVLGLIAVVTWVGSRASLARPVRLGAAAFLALAVVVASAWASFAPWDDQQRWARMDRPKVEQAATAIAYLERIGYEDGRPLVFIVDDRGPNPDAYVGLMADMIRVAMPAWRMDNTYLYVGTPENYLARRPTTSTSSPFYGPASARYFEVLEPLFDERPVAFVTAAFNDTAWSDWISANPDTRVGSEVAVVEGGPVDVEIPTPVLPLGGIRLIKLLALGGGTLAIFGLTGLGWAFALFRRRLRPFELLAVAPALGVGAIVLTGVLFDRAGLRLRGFAGTSVVLIALAAGWALWAWRSRVRDSEAAPADA